VVDEHLELAWRAVAIAAATLLSFRVALLLAHGKAGLPYPVPDLLRGFLMGSRFDLKVATILVAPGLLLLALLRLPWPASRLLRGAALLFPALAFALCDVLAVTNHFYYGFYRSPINAIVFGLVEDDTRAVLATVWQEYPVAWAALGTLALLLAQMRLLRWRLPALRLGPWGRAAAVLLTLAVLGVLARGKLGTFPLRDVDLVVSAQGFVNDLVPSGPEALHVAWVQRRQSTLENDVNAGLGRLGFATPRTAAEALGLPAADPAQLLASLYPPARPNPWASARPPHVVVALMESWSADLLAYHGPGNDLLGRLAGHLDHGALLRRFVQIQDGTDGTLESLLLGTPVTPLTYAQYGLVPYDTSVARPYARSGYRTAFLTSGNGGWRNLRRVLPVQGFAEFYDEFDLRQAFPDAPAHTWGLHDGPMWQFASQLLAEADARGEKLFLVVLTTSNHPPHAIPADYRPGPLDLRAFGGRVAVEPALGLSMLQTTQYACDALGGFLDRLEQAGLGDRTLLAALGDHNIRNFFSYPDSREALRRYGVPLLLHLPRAALQGKRLDPQRLAGPRDLFPTLYGLSLPGEHALFTGQDLLLPADRPRAITSYSTIIADAGAVVGLTQPIFLSWDPDGGLVPCATDACREPLQKILDEERAHTALLDWNIRRQALKR
jgi:phosphoglycerol transferase MdoB-like AlkP superfamily enzyme